MKRMPVMTGRSQRRPDHSLCVQRYTAKQQSKWRNSRVPDGNKVCRSNETRDWARSRDEVPREKRRDGGDFEGPDLVGKPGGKADLDQSVAALRLEAVQKQGPGDRWTCSWSTRVSKIAAVQSEGIQGAGGAMCPLGSTKQQECRGGRGQGGTNEASRTSQGNALPILRWAGGFAEPKALSGAAVPSKCIWATALVDGVEGREEERRRAARGAGEDEARNSLDSVNTGPIECDSAAVAADASKPTHAARQ